MEWPLVALIIGIVAVIATWDCVRRLTVTRDLESRVEKKLAAFSVDLEEQLDAQDTEFEKRLGDHAELISTLRKGTDEYVRQTTQEINALKNGLAVRSMRS